MIKKSVPDSPIQGEFFWLRVTGFSTGATISIDSENPFVVDCLEYFHCRKDRPWRKGIVLTGTVTIELGDSEDEKFPGAILG